MIQQQGSSQRDRDWKKKQEKLGPFFPGKVHSGIGKSSAVPVKPTCQVKNVASLEVSPEPSMSEDYHIKVGKQVSTKVKPLGSFMLV